MMKSLNDTHLVTVPRTTVEVHLPDGRIICGPRNQPIAAFLKGLPEWNNHDPIMGAVINGELRELTHPVELDSRVRLVKMSDPDGSGIYRRSITFLLEAAFEDTFPDSGHLHRPLALLGRFLLLGDQPRRRSPRKSWRPSRRA